MLYLHFTRRVKVVAVSVQRSRNLLLSITKQEIVISSKLVFRSTQQPGQELGTATGKLEDLWAKMQSGEGAGLGAD